MEVPSMKIADSVWLATALLHMENAQATDFSGQEILEKATQENLVDGFRPGFQVHVSKHCVANKSPNPGRYRMLFETSRGRRRLFRNGDEFHPNRDGGRTKPNVSDIPPEYRGVMRWYEKFYDKGSLLPRIDLMARVSTGDSRKTQTGAEPISPRPIQGDARAENLQIVDSSTLRVHSNGDVTLPLNLREELGIVTGTCLTIQREENHLVLQPVTNEFIRSLRGCCKGEGSMIEDREREHKIEKDRMANE
jgi:bifunctional DNA-binding transcriptional regulator/antitoxin component of YhaV-PrlF toxin-antitoxin module